MLISCGNFLFFFSLISSHFTAFPSFFQYFFTIFGIIFSINFTSYFFFAGKTKKDSSFMGIHHFFTARTFMKIILKHIRTQLLLLDLLDKEFRFFQRYKPNILFFRNYNPLRKVLKSCGHEQRRS